MGFSSRGCEDTIATLTTATAAADTAPAPTATVAGCVEAAAHGGVATNRGRAALGAGPLGAFGGGDSKAAALCGQEDCRDV
jgi:hypothetical protein